jgi:hypothetical protein
MWDVHSFYSKEGKEVGSWVAVQPGFAEGRLSFTTKWLAKPVEPWIDAAAELWTYRDRLQARYTKPDGSGVFLTYSRVPR